MPFRPKRVFPQFEDLKGILAQSRNELDHASYQTIQTIIERLSQQRGVMLEQLLSRDDAILLYATRFATFITVEDETSQLPNSYQIIAGPGITLDTSVPNQITISASGSGSAYYDSPLTDGDFDETDLIFASGDPVIVQVPNVP